MIRSLPFGLCRFVWVWLIVLAPLFASARPMAAQAPTQAPTAHVPAIAPVPYFVKTAATLAELEKTLAGPGAHSGDLLKPGATALEIVWRHEEDIEQKEVESHDGKDHVFFVTEGQATFTLGGQLLEPREISPGEWKATKVQGAQLVTVNKGDLLFIPHGTVHGRSAKGQKFTMLQLSFWPGGAPAPKASAASQGNKDGQGNKDAKLAAPPSRATQPPTQVAPAAPLAKPRP